MSIEMWKLEILYATELPIIVNIFQVSFSTMNEIVTSKQTKNLGLTSTAYLVFMK